jgi:hypothetical protein
MEDRIVVEIVTIVKAVDHILKLTVEILLIENKSIIAYLKLYNFFYSYFLLFLSSNY